MRNLLLVASLAACINVYAQGVGIGTNSPAPSSILELQSTNKGLLIPRLTTAQRTAISLPAEGLMVFDTDLKEIFIYKNSSWQNILPSNTSWSLTGNSGTLSGNFIGTTDVQTLRFRVNNIPSGFINVTPNGNTAFGQKTLTSLTSGFKNAAFGFGALAANTTGYFNTAIGDSALYANIGGYANTAVGFRSLVANKGGSGNTGIGAYTLFSNESGSYNTALGLIALGDNTTGENNTAIGYFSMRRNESGYGNVAIGNFSLSENKAAHGNTATGFVALEKNTTGIWNSAFGALALSKNITGEHNTALGYDALRENLLGSYNTSVGFRSLYLSQGRGNTAVGYEAMYNNVKGNHNTVIGHKANITADSLENATAIGARALVTQHHSMVLGSIKNVNGATESVKVGIGTTTPKAALHVEDSSVVFSTSEITFSLNPPPPPITGAGRRMMWYADKTAFRVGSVNGNNWDESNIGYFSFAGGNNARAKGSVSFAFGNNAIADEPNSIALGNNANALRSNSAAIGSGIRTTGASSFALGLGLVTRAYGSTVVGVYNDSIISNSQNDYSSGRNAVFIVGNGSPTTRKNAMVILINGNVGLGTNEPKAKLHLIEGDILSFSPNEAPAIAGDPPASGEGRRIMWDNERAAFRAGYVSGTQWDYGFIGKYSIATGYNAQARGLASIAIGNTVNAFGDNSIVFGRNVGANGNGSFTLGDNDPNGKGMRATVSDNLFWARFNGGYYLVSNDAGADIGVRVLAGGNSWTTISDKNMKENFEPVDGETLLEKLAKIPQYTWNYKGQDPSSFRHYGPMAQDFYKAFGKDGYGTIGCDTLINQHDFIGVNMVAIQALEKRTAEQQHKHQQQQMVIAKLETELFALKTQYQELLQMLKTKK